MIILEGVDCSGKSTLAEKLSAKYDAPITHYSKHEEENMLKHALLSKPGTGEIVDRFHLSEIPYTMYYRHGVPQYDSVIKIDLALRETKCLQIVCTPPWTVVKEHWENRKEDELIQSIDALHGIYMWYRDKSQAFSSFQVWNYDYTRTSFDSLCEEIDTWSREYETT